MTKKAKGFIFISFIIFSTLVFAAGSGGGGTTPPPPPPCTEDSWQCSEWEPCQSDNTQTRTCRLVRDCATVQTPKPEEIASCAFVSQLLQGLKCHNLLNLKSRISCRLDLSERDLQQELQIAYLPEECRTLESENEKEACVRVYSDSQPCWEKPIGPERMACIREVLQVSDIVQEKNNCGVNGDCLNALKRKAFGLIKFRFYDLEEKAEELLEEKKASKKLVVEFIADLETKKAAFNQAETKQERKQIILDVRERWKQFLKNVKEYLKGKTA